jgi:hypothetical protein
MSSKQPTFDISITTSCFCERHVFRQACGDADKLLWVLKGAKGSFVAPSPPLGLVLTPLPTDTLHDNRLTDTLYIVADTCSSKQTPTVSAPAPPGPHAAACASTAFRKTRAPPAKCAPPSPLLHHERRREGRARVIGPCQLLSADSHTRGTSPAKLNRL